MSAYFYFGLLGALNIFTEHEMRLFVLVRRLLGMLAYFYGLYRYCQQLYTCLDTPKDAAFYNTNTHASHDDKNDF